MLSRDRTWSVCSVTDEVDAKILAAPNIKPVSQGSTIWVRAVEAVGDRQDMVGRRR